MKNFFKALKTSEHQIVTAHYSKASKKARKQEFKQPKPKRGIR